MQSTFTVTGTPTEIQSWLAGMPTTPAAPAPKAATKQAKEPIPAPEASSDKDLTASTEKISIEVVRAAAQAKMQGGKREEVKTLLTEFGVDKVTALSVDQYPSFLERVNAI